MEEDNKFIDETEIDPVKKSQNRIISILVLFVVGLLLYLTGRSNANFAFELFLILFLIANSLYLLAELIRFYRFKSQMKKNETEEGNE